MELLLLIAGLLLLDILAMRFGVDSRILDVRDTRRWWPDLMIGDMWHDAARLHHVRLHSEASAHRLIGLARVAAVPRLSRRIRMGHALRNLAVLIDPATYDAVACHTHTAAPARHS